MASVSHGLSCSLDVTENCDKHEVGHPVIVHFTNGQLKPESIEKVKFNILQGNSSYCRDKDQYLISAETDKLTYINNHEKEKCNSGVRYYVGLFDKTTNRMKILPSVIQQLSPVLKDNEDLSKKIDSKKRNKSKREQADELTSVFGSKRKRRAIESRHKRVVEQSELVQVMDKTTEEVNVSASEIDQTDSSTLSLLPSVNWNASQLEDVYNIEDLMGEEDFECLDEMANQLASCTQEDIALWKTEKKYSNYILNHLENFLCDSTDLRKLKMLLFMHFYLVLYQLKYKDLRKRDPFPGEIPPQIKRKLLESFTQSGATARSARCMPLQLKDKLTAHILVLGLIIDKYRFSLYSLPEIKVPQTRLSLLVRAVGAKLENTSTKFGKISLVKLTLPLSRFTDKSKRNYKK